MNLPITPALPPLDPSAAAAPAPGAGGATDGSAFRAHLEPTAEAQPSGAVAEIEATRHVSMVETPQAIHELVTHVLERGQDMKPAELIAVQLRVHEMTFQLESVSKAIEHAMSGTKTLLQTQA